jgi:hypothetical protein
VGIAEKCGGSSNIEYTGNGPPTKNQHGVAWLADPPFALSFPVKRVEFRGLEGIEREE